MNISFWLAVVPRPAKLVSILFIFLGLLLGSFFQKAGAEPQTVETEILSPLNLLVEEDRTALNQGQAVDVIVEFDQTEAVNLAATRRTQKAIQYDDEEILAERARQYKWQKAKTLATLATPLSVLHDYDQLPMLFARVRSSNIKELLKQPSVKAVHSNKKVQLSLAESLPLINQPLTAISGGWGNGVAVAVIDSGVDFTRAAFGNCTEPNLPANTCRVVAAVDIAPDDNARDNNGHGTNVAGIVLGVAPRANIVALDVNHDAQGHSNSANIISAINWVIGRRAEFSIVAMNMSLGGDKFTTTCPNDAFATPIRNARQAGILTIASSGNSGWKDALGSPACVPEAVSVGAVYDSDVGGMRWSSCTDGTTRADQVTCFSNSANFLTLLAPGAMITAAEITMGGTSQAAPHVAGAIAVLRAAYPSETLDRTVERLTSTGVQITDTNQIARPRIDLLRAYGGGGGVLPAILSIILDDDAPVSYRLAVNKVGNNGGAGTVTSSPAGINCGSTCSANFNRGTAVTLTARPTSGTFGGWTGAGCSGTGNCVVTMTAAQSVIATFNGGGSGEVFPPNGVWPSGWTAPATSNANWTVASGAAHEGNYSLRSGVIGHNQKSQVQVRRTFQAGTIRFARKVSSEGNYDFLRFYVDGVKKGEWSGTQAWAVVSYPLTAGTHTLLWSYEKDGSDVAGSDAAWIDSVLLPPAGGPTYALTVTKDGTGTGTVTSAPAGINCGTVCSANFNSGASVTLTPAAASGSTFAGWAGACTNRTGNCVVGMTAAKSVKATFNRVTSSCLSSMTVGATVSGSWAAGCNSTHRSGRYAKYYTFTLSTPRTVVINLTSAVDSYLFLLSGNGMNGAVIAQDDDSGGSSNARITKALAAGTYTVEATTYTAATAGSFSLSVQPSGGVNLVTNGGFENLGTGITMPPAGWYTYSAGDTFPGWRVASGSVDIQTSAHGPVHSGSHALDLAGSAAGSISQTLPTVAGRQYTLELWYAAHPYHPYSGPAQAQVRWGGSNVGLLSRDPTTTTTNSMTRVQYVVTAASSTTTLSLVGLSPNGGIIVDEVSVIAR
jgi:hypothetical protein